MSFVALCLAGCGGIREPERLPVAPVEGIVTYRGKPVPDADVVFHPEFREDEAGPCYGTTDGSGKYQLTTYQPHDGALLGKHRITIVVRQKTADGAVSKSESAIGTLVPASGAESIPARYADEAKTDLAAEVEEGPNVINLELKD